MPKVHPDVLIRLFEINYNVIKQKTENVTHEQSLCQLPFPGNCFNWVLGHLLISRDSVLKWLGEEPMWDDEKRKPYDYGSPQMTDVNTPGVQPFEQILADYVTGHERLVTALKALNPEKLDEVMNEKGTTLADRIVFMTFHDAYHTGQTEYLRELAGHRDGRI